MKRLGDVVELFFSGSFFPPPGTTDASEQEGTRRSTEAIDVVMRLRKFVHFSISELNFLKQ